MVDDTRQSHLQLLSGTSQGRNERERGGKTSPLSIAVYVIAVAGSMAFIIYYARNLEAYLEDLKLLGLWGNLIFIVSYIPAGLPFALVSYYIPLSLSAGFLYREALGLATAMLGSVFASMFGFWLTRTFCRSWIEEKIKSSVRLSALLLAMEIHSFKVTLMVRFLPVPFGLQNALCAMTSITSPKFLLSSAIGLLPENMLLIYFGSTFDTIADTKHGDFGSIPTYEKVILGAAVLATGIIFFIGRKMLDATLAMARAGNKKTEKEGRGAEGEEEEEGVDLELLGAEAGENGNGKDGDVEIEIHVDVKKSQNFVKDRERERGRGEERERGREGERERERDIHNKEPHTSITITPVKINKSSNMLPDPPSITKHKEHKAHKG